MPNRDETPTRRTIDDLLGPAENRYFGCTYQLVTHSLADLVIDARSVAGTAAVTYPSNWSVKSGRDTEPPHLSGIDALVLSIQSAEILFASAYGLPPNALHVHENTIKAGPTLVHDLDGLAVRTRWTSNAGTGPPATRSRLRSHVANFAVDLVVDHEPLTLAIDDGWHRRASTAGEVLGEAAQRYFGDGYKETGLTLTDIELDRQQPAVNARLRVEPSAAFPRVGPVDAYRTIAQLTQVLVFDLAGKSREQGPTLLLRKLTYCCPRALSGSLDTRVSLQLPHHTIVALNGKQWRSGRVSLAIEDIAVNAQFAIQVEEETAE